MSQARGRGGVREECAATAGVAWVAAVAAMVAAVVRGDSLKA